MTTDAPANPMPTRRGYTERRKPTGMPNRKSPPTTADDPVMCPLTPDGVLCSPSPASASTESCAIAPGSSGRPSGVAPRGLRWGPSRTAASTTSRPCRDCSANRERYSREPGSVGRCSVAGALVPARPIGGSEQAPVIGPKVTGTSTGSMRQALWGGPSPCGR